MMYNISWTRNSFVAKDPFKYITFMLQTPLDIYLIKIILYNNTLSVY